MASGSETVDDEQPKRIKCIDFNQDFSCICIGTNADYQIHDITVEKNNLVLKKMCTNSAAMECMSVARLFTSSLVAFVLEGYPRKLSINHFKRESHICSYTYQSSILNVLLNRERLVVVCEDRLSIHIVKDMELIHTIQDTPANPEGICALSNDSHQCYLAYPASNTMGEVQIFDVFNLKPVCRVSAHESPIRCMTFNNVGTQIATASEKGTVIRVFSIDPTDGSISRLYELRRGIARSATIHCLNFSLSSKFLCASSNTQTIHVFKLTPSEPTQDSGAASTYTETMYSYLSGAVSATAAFLPSTVSGMMVQERAFAWCSLPKEGEVTRVAVVEKAKGSTKLVVATISGVVHVYNLNPEIGGECTLDQKYDLLPDLPSDGIEITSKSSGLEADEQNMSAMSDLSLQSNLTNEED